MLFRRADLDRIVSGDVTLAFRRWRRPTVKTGGTLRTAAGVLCIEHVEQTTEAAVTSADARAAGYPSRAALLQALAAHDGGVLYRVRLRPAGIADPRDALRAAADLTSSDVATLRATLARLDQRSPSGPWTSATLHAIAARPGTVSTALAAELGVERFWLKTQIRKLKALGLTESLEVGYRLSPRGQAWLRVE